MRGFFFSMVNFTKATLGVIAAFLVLALFNVAAFVGLGAIAPWMKFGATEDAERALPAEKEPAAVSVLDVPDGKTPAQVVINRALKGKPSPLTGWRPAAAVQDSAGLPFEFECGSPKKPGPVVDDMKAWVKSSGPSVSNVSGSVTVNLRAYTAGGGAAAFDNIIDLVSKCSEAYPASYSGIGVSSIALISTRTTTLMWRRGDIIGLSTYQSGSRAGSSSFAAQVAGAVDQKLERAMNGLCLDQTGDESDIYRSPWVDRLTFSGLTDKKKLKLKRPKNVKPARERVDSSIITQIPASELDSPDFVYRPTRPADPVWPPALPAEMSKPSMPYEPFPYQSFELVPLRIPDVNGPGCGWEFAGTQPPLFDGEAAEEEYETARSAAQSRLQSGWKLLQRQKAKYWRQYDQYTADVRAYRQYASEVSEIATAWANIVQARETYAANLALWQAAKDARRQFIIDQNAAERRYRADRTECRNYVPPPPPEPEPEPEPTRNPDRPNNGNGNGNGTASPSPSPTPAQEPEPFVDPNAPECPAPRPAILDQAPPPVPQKPTPPPNPIPPSER